MSRPQQTVLNTFVDQTSFLGDGSIGNPLRLNSNNVSPNVPYVDLTRPPYSVVTNDTTAAQMVANAQAIDAFAADFDGSGAWGWLPGKGEDTYVSTDFAATPLRQTCIDWTGRSNLVLASFGGKLIQQGVGNGPGGDWHLFTAWEGSQNLGFWNMFWEQGVISNTNVGQHNHVVFFRNVTGATTSGFTLWNNKWGKCIGDALRCLGDDGVAAHGWTVDNVRVLNPYMRLHGIVDLASGRVGGRSGISLQRGVSNFWALDVDIDGTQNQAIDCEPSGVGGETMDNINITGVIGNTDGSTSIPASIGGGVAGAIVATRVFVDLKVTSGQIRFNHLRNSNCNVNSEVMNLLPDANFANVACRGVLENVAVNVIGKRGGNADAAAIVDVETPSTVGFKLTGNLVQETAASPVVMDGVSYPVIDLDITYNAINPGSNWGVVLNAVLLNCKNPDVSVRLRSLTGKMSAAVAFGLRAPRDLSGVICRNIQSAGSAFAGVLFSFGAGATFDEHPLLLCINNGTDALYRAEDAGGAVINTVFPVFNNRCAIQAQYQSQLAIMGVGVPAMAAPDGSTFARLDGGPGVPGLYVMENAVWTPK